MTIRRLVQGVFLTLMILAMVCAAFIVYAVMQRRSLVDMQAHRFRSYQLAGELRRSSDDLTRFVRMYVATGDRRYEQYYRDVLAIRAGTKARPEHYEKVYWDLLLDGGTPPRPDAQPIALRALMRQQGFTDAELAQLSVAEDRSNALAVIEETAIHAMQGEFRDNQGGFTRRGAPDRALASRLVHDSAYLHAKARIMQPIDEFLSMVDTRGTAELEAFTHSTRVTFATLEALLAVFLLVVFLSYPVLANRILAPVNTLQVHTRDVALDLARLAGTTKHISEGDLKQAYSVTTAPIENKRADEIGELSRLHDSMIGQLQSTGESISSITSELKLADVVNKQRFEAIFQASPVPLAVSIAETGKIVEANRKALEHLGAKTPEDLIGKSTIELGVWPAEERQKIIDGIAKHGRLEALPLTMRRLDGRTMKVELWSTYYVAGDVRYLLTSTVDVTERLALEDQLRQSQKMDALGRLAGGIAHDFNNVLTAIIGFGQLTISDMAKGKGSKADVEEMVKAAERAAEMTRQLLAFSRKQVVELRDLNITKTLGGVEKMLRRMIGSDVTLKTSLAADLGNIRADAGQFEQIVANLAVNARDAMPAGGTVTMTTSNVVVDDRFVAANPEARPGAFVRLTVSDTGTGMTTDTITRIFEPFFTTKEVGKGTGLGLSTVFGIVKQANGFILVHSVVDRGTSFEVYFPRVEPVAPVAAASDSVAAAQGGRETILATESDTALLELMSRVLRERGYNVISADGPEKALAMAEQHTGVIDLLLTDVVMAGMNGRALANGLTRVRPGLRVLYISGHPDEVLGRHGVLDANISLLAKPFTPDTLAAKVRKILDAAS